MADYDSNMIKPVEGLQNITGLTPVKRREQRKRKQQFPEEKEEKEEKDESAEGELSESVNEHDLDNPAEGRSEDENGRNPDSVAIDYCA